MAKKLDPFPGKEYLDTLGKTLADRAAIRVRPKIKSRTLRHNLRVRRKYASGVRSDYALFIPHYWAQYYHDDRRGFTAKGNKWLVWFRNPQEDPRHRGNYPKRLTQKRKLNLSKRQMRRLRKQKKIVFAKSVGPAKGEKFFDNSVGMLGFSQEASGVITGSFSKAVNEYMGEYMDMKITKSLRIG